MVSFFYADIDNGFDEFTLQNSRTRTYSDQPGRDEQESFGTSWRANWTDDQIEVVSTTSYMGTDSTYSFDGDFTNVKALIPNQLTTSYSIEREREVINQEIRFDSADSEDALGFIDRWTTGIYFQSFDEQSGIEFVNDGTPSAFQTAYERRNIQSLRTRHPLTRRKDENNTWCPRGVFRLRNKHRNRRTHGLRRLLWVAR
jgi:hypothetical protein